ncbi:TetR/AcrR family transcriptional regulator [Acholeplasma hippikon]|uniref:DNA-binding transcriptional repressor AcrR n=1 Tax=Acholeplasma hippikon TaxID=264636 RepID=A0A449BL55_9MOLU|nr:TetR/AcrR family transcriptional regulator [Acholeplasma hippikon]VEU83164.1 DNA-binding transcriptional repressor AcrR [Acholeplasma hippikon]
MTTKELIYKNAIELFSQYGYQNLGMRDLAKSAGIKASSIYNHYKSKEDILLDIANELVNELKENVYPLYKVTDLSPKEFFKNISLKTNQFFEQKHINTLTGILIPEEFSSQRLKKLLHEEFIVKPRTAYTYYFKSLMDKGLMRTEDPKLAAKMYHSFFVYHFYEKYLTNDPEGFLVKDESIFVNHIDLFMKYFDIK